VTSPDIVICLLLLLSALIGLFRGLVKEVLSLIIWIAAFVVALLFAQQVSELLAARIENTSVRMILAFAAIFISALIAGAIVQWVLAKLIETTGLSGTDRLLGFLFGSIRGVLLCIVILIVVRPFAQDASWWQTSILVPQLIAFESDVVGFLNYLGGVVTDLGKEI
jgi:membrane protein required for colicin V production